MSQKNARVTNENLNMAQIRNTYCSSANDMDDNEISHEIRLNHFLQVMSEKAIRMDNLTLTANGALTFKSSGSALVDFHARTTELRHASSEEIGAALYCAYKEDPILAVKLVFQTGDIRGGKGERAIFNTCMDHLSIFQPAVALELLPLIPTYTRWDYLVRLCVSGNEKIAKKATELVATQFKNDLAIVRNTAEGGESHISLLGKWMPSLQTKKAEHKAMVRHLLRALHMQEREYRHALSVLREHLNVIEKFMSLKEHNSIDMEKMSAKQQLRYSAFLQKVMGERRHAFIQAVLRGEAKMNASVLNPVEICHEYAKGSWNGIAEGNEDLEALWKLLPDKTNGNGRTLVVRDGSGSMTSRIGHGSSATMLEAATALTIYCAEKLTGPLKDKFLTFSHAPRLIDLSCHATLKDRLNYIYKYDECSNTDIEATFDLLLNAAVTAGLRQEDLPSYLLILSDMDFDEARRDSYNYNAISPVDRQTLFEAIRAKWGKAGYQVPTLVFWNLNGRRTTFPETDSENGVIFLSGFSTNELTMVMNGDFEKIEEFQQSETVVNEATGEKTVITRTVTQRIVLSPKEQLTAKLSNARYDAVEEAVQRGMANSDSQCDQNIQCL